MSKNSSPSLLDQQMILQRSFDESNDALRVEVGVGTSFALNISADSGDSVTSIPSVVENKASITSANTGTVMSSSPCIGMKSFNLYTNTTSTITGAQACTLQVSPSDTDDVWINTTLTITPSTTASTVVVGTVNTAIVARRMRVNIAAAISSGTFDLYLVAQSV